MNYRSLISVSASSSTNLQYLWETEEPDTVEVLVEGKHVHVKKEPLLRYPTLLTLLNIRCEYFQSLFHFRELQQKTSQPIEMSDVGLEGFIGLIEWLNLRTLDSIKTMEGLLQCWQLAEMYGLEDLRQNCQWHIHAVMQGSSIDSSVAYLVDVFQASQNNDHSAFNDSWWPGILLSAEQLNELAMFCARTLRYYIDRVLILCAELFFLLNFNDIDLLVEILL